MNNEEYMLIYIEGMDNYEDGAMVNPYPACSDAAEAWRKGFNDAKGRHYEGLEDKASNPMLFHILASICIAIIILIIAVSML